MYKEIYCVAGSFKEATIYDMYMIQLHSLVFMPRHKELEI